MTTFSESSESSKKTNNTAKPDLKLMDDEQQVFFARRTKKNCELLQIPGLEFKIQDLRENNKVEQNIDTSSFEFFLSTLRVLNSWLISRF